MGFQLFAGGLAVSHKYAHVSGYGEPIEIGGLKILPGDLIHGDRHGVHNIPLSVAPDVAGMAAEMRNEERDLKDFCRSSQFSLQGLDKRLEHNPGDRFEPHLR